jgi:hypothetical protein
MVRLRVGIASWVYFTPKNSRRPSSNTGGDGLMDQDLTVQSKSDLRFNWSLVWLDGEELFTAFREQQWQKHWEYGGVIQPNNPTVKLIDLISTVNNALSFQVSTPPH